MIGRYYAMDRDKRWERIKKAYDLLIKGEGEHTRNFLQTLEQSYEKGITDEFLLPVVLVDDQDKPVGRIHEGDVVICFNFRTDRCRQITMALTQKDFPEYDMKTIPLYYVTMTNYDDTFRNVKVIFDKEHLHDTLGEAISKNGLTQLRIAETEKYPHVTFFFSGGREKVFEGEERIMIPSPKVKTYDLQPEMSALQVKDAVIEYLRKHHPDFVCLNFANPDMVGHTGVFPAIVKAIETVDFCAGEVVKEAVNLGYIVWIIADHGNAEYTINEDGSPNTAHTTNPVPSIIINADVKTLKEGILADVAPTILTLMGLEIPEVMTGKILTE
jgi:2,3-bisphosphoglycerate-independent phosphoglycerate mutase